MHSWKVLVQSQACCRKETLAAKFKNNLNQHNPSLFRSLNEDSALRRMRCEPGNTAAGLCVLAVRVSQHGEAGKQKPEIEKEGEKAQTANERQLF